MLIIVSILLLISSCKKNEEEIKILDADGNIYTSVTIGAQVWLVENLKTTKLNDGTAISLITEQTAWSITSEPAYCWYDKDISNKDPYRALYNWYAVNTGKLCPKEWHAPSEAELAELVNFLGVEDGMYDLRNTLKRISDVKLGPDLNWLLRAGVDPVNFIKEFRNQIVFTHLRDQLSNGRWPESLGEGNVDFREIADALNEIGFNGDIVVELAHENGFARTRPLKESLKMSREYLRKIMKI